MLMTAGVFIFIVLLLATAVQLIYYLYFFRRLAYYREPPETEGGTQPVSVIVCARDEEKALRQNLPFILSQAYLHPHEVVVVNDNSFDDSQAVLEALKKETGQLNIVQLTQEAKHIVGKKYPLSIGIKEAKGPLLLLTDADCFPASGQWLQKMQAGFILDKEIVLGYGAYAKAPGILNKLIRFETFHTALQYLSYALAGKTYMGVGRNLAYKKEVFFRHKGFASINHIASGDDDLFISRAATTHNTAIVIDKEAFTFSEPKKTWRQWQRQKSRHYTTGRYYKSSHKALLGLYSLTLFLIYPLLAASIFLFNWRYALAAAVLRLCVQGVIWRKAMKKLGEEDLFPYFVLFDIWQFFYYFIFAFSLWKKPRKTWN